MPRARDRGRNRRGRRAVLLAGLLAALALVSGSAAAEPAEGDNRQRSLRMNELEILGEVEKPKTLFVIPRTPHVYYREETKRDFTEEILAPINKQKVRELEEWLGPGDTAP